MCVCVCVCVWTIGKRGDSLVFFVRVRKRGKDVMKNVCKEEEKGGKGREGKGREVK